MAKVGYGSDLQNNYCADFAKYIDNCLFFLYVLASG